MISLKFKAYSVTNEIDLNRIAVKCSITKKYTWEEPLILQGELLEKILKAKLRDDQKVMLFSFGSIVFINIEHQLYSALIDYLKEFNTEINSSWEYYNEDYALHIASNEEVALTDKYVVINEFQPFYPELIAITLAKSVALERVEEHLGKILDSIENLIVHLENGKFHIGDKSLARTTAEVARHEYNSINYIMILDKPDITWSNSEAGEFYDKMSEFFELSDRFAIIGRKSDILSNIINNFASISHSTRGLFVELVIVLLIVVEVILMFAELFK